MAAAAVAGCSYADQPLNGPAVPLERRLTNATRAATFAAVRPPQPAEPAAAVPREIEPASGPSATAPVDTVPDGTFVGLALSGGGSRAANFSAACMFQLQRLGLLQRVDYLSVVSGGGLAGAYYCTHGNGDGGWNPELVQQRLTHAFATDILVDTLLPWNAVALLLSDYDRSDLLAHTLADHLFARADGHPQTFADLRADRPRLLVNATDLQSGRRFVFCNETFDALNADLARYPVAYAVAASSSVPVILHEVTVRDFSTTFPAYRHLIDGGVVDNLGIQSLVETYRAQQEAARSAGRPDPYPRGAVFLIVDARVDADRDLSTRSDTGTVSAITAAAGLSTRALVNRASSASLTDVVLRNAADTATAGDLRRVLAQLETTGYAEFDNVGRHPVRVARLALTQLAELDQPPSNSLLAAVNSTGTYYNIDPDRARTLYEAADLLVRGRFEATLRQLAAEVAGPASRP